MSGNQFSQVSEFSLGWQDFPQGSHDCLLHPVGGLIARRVRGGSGLHLGLFAVALLLDCRLWGRREGEQEKRRRGGGEEQA